MEYFQLYDKDMQRLQLLPDPAQRWAILEAAAAYAYHGQETDFTGDPLMMIVWMDIKDGIDAAKRKSAARSAAGSQGGRGNQSNNSENQPKANESNRKQTKANENKTPIIDTDTETDTETERTTHTVNQQQGTRGRARAKTPASCWFDPARPSTWTDETWRTSDKVRWAVAQRVVDYAANSGIDMRPGSGGEGAHLVDAMVAAMETGVKPGFFAESVSRSETAIELEDQVLSQLGVMVGSSGMREKYPLWYDRLLSIGMWGGKQTTTRVS